MRKAAAFFKALCIAGFLLLCGLHFFSCRPLWLDEQSVLENLSTRSTAELFAPLARCQAFPRAYLAGIRAFALQFSFHPLSLRFFPLLCMCAGFLVWMKIYREELGEGVSFFLCLFSFAFSYRMSYYAAEFKPYSMDVLSVGLFVLFMRSQAKRLKAGGGHRLWVAVILPFLLFFSYAALFACWIVLLNFAFLQGTGRSRREALAYLCSLFLCVAGLYVFDLRYGLRQQCLYGYWKDYFLCGASPYCFIRSFGEGLQRIAVWFYADNPYLKKAGSFFIPFFFAGLVSFFARFFKEKRGACDAGTASAALFSALFVLGLAGKYPFTGERITLFFAPFVFYATAAGIRLARRYWPLYIVALSAYCVFLFACGADAFLKFFRLFSR